MGKKGKTTENTNQKLSLAIKSGKAADLELSAEELKELYELNELENFTGSS